MISRHWSNSKELKCGELYIMTDDDNNLYDNNLYDNTWKVYMGSNNVVNKLRTISCGTICFILSIVAADNRVLDIRLIAGRAVGHVYIYDNDKCFKPLSCSSKSEW